MHHGAYGGSDGTGSPCAMGRTLGEMLQVLHVPWGVRHVRYYRFSLYHGAYARPELGNFLIGKMMGYVS